MFVVLWRLSETPDDGQSQQKKNMLNPGDLETDLLAFSKITDDTDVVQAKRRMHSLDEHCKKIMSQQQDSEENVIFRPVVESFICGGFEIWILFNTREV